MPYVYQNLQANPYAQSIGELMQRKGDIQARTAENIGQIRARAQEMSGQIAAHAAEAIGQQVASIPGQIQQQKEQAQRTKVADLDLNAKQRAADATAALSSVMKDTPKLSEDGVSVWDTAKITQAMADKGFGPEAGAAAQHLDGINNAFRQTRAAQLGVVQKGAQAVAAAGNDSTLAHHFLDQLEANQIYPKEEVQKYRDFIDADTGNTAKLTAYLMGPQKGQVVPEGATVVNPVTNQPTFSNPKPAPQPTEASIALNAAQGDPNSLLAMHLLKPGEQVKAGTQEDWVDRARRLAVGANQGQPLNDKQLQDVDTKAIQQFHEINTDPELRAANLAQKNLAQVLSQIQAGQQPTREDAAVIAKQVLNHQMAPSQAMATGGYGAAGAAFKRMVNVEIAKEDPTFSWEQAEADYNYSKNPAFQNTVRFIDSTLESMPRLLDSAKALDQGKVASINKLIADGKKQVNSVDLKKFQTDAIFVGDEIAKILQGGGTGSGTSDAKLKQAQDIFSTSDNPQTIAAALEEIQPLLGNRRRAVTRGTPYEKQNSVPKAPETLIPGLKISRGSGG